MPTEPRFSFYVIPFKNEPLAKSVERLARLGFNGFELPGEPGLFKPADVNALREEHRIEVSSICGRMYGPERDLSTADPNNRAAAVDYFKSLVDLAVAVDAPSIVLAPTAVRRNMPESSVEQEWAFAVEGIRQVADAARGTPVKIIIEPWNRYETHLLNRIEQAMQMCGDVGAGNVGVMGDLFHMNIEEQNPAEAIRAAGPLLLNIHFADSNRKAPGRGHIDFVPIMAALQAIEYQHYLSTEFLPPRFIFEFGVPAEFYEPYPAETIQTLRSVWDGAVRSGGEKGARS